MGAAFDSTELVAGQPRSALIVITEIAAGPVKSGCKQKPLPQLKITSSAKTIGDCKGDLMTAENVKRKLTAILSADVEGYSRLMG